MTLFYIIRSQFPLSFVQNCWHFCTKLIASIKKIKNERKRRSCVQPVPFAAVFSRQCSKKVTLSLCTFDCHSHNTHTHQNSLSFKCRWCDKSISNSCAFVFMMTANGGRPYSILWWIFGIAYYPAAHIHQVITLLFHFFFSVFFFKFRQIAFNARLMRYISVSQAAWLKHSEYTYHVFFYQHCHRWHAMIEIATVCT